LAVSDKGRSYKQGTNINKQQPEPQQYNTNMVQTK